MRRSLAVLTVVVATIALTPSSVFSQHRLPDVVVVAPRNSPTTGPMTQLLQMFMQGIRNWYHVQDLARQNCQQASIAAVDAGCELVGGTADGEAFFRNVMAGSMIAQSGRIGFQQVANDFGYYLRQHGPAMGPSVAMSDLRNECFAAYSGGSAVACVDELTSRITRSLEEGGFGGLSAEDADRMARGRECIDHMNDIEEFCGRTAGQ